MIHLEERGSHRLLRLEHGRVSALDVELLEELVARLQEIERSPYGAVVVTGTGSSFSVGVDLWRLLEGGDDYLERLLPAFQTALSRFFIFPRPLVAAINGHAIAGGCVFACACDYRLMVGHGGKVGVPELRVGVPFPGLALEVLRHAGGGRHLHELVFRGRLYEPEDGLRTGLVDELCPPEELLDRAFAVADELASIPPATFALTKRQLRQPALDRAAGHARQTEADVVRTWSDPEIHQIIRAYMEATVRSQG